MVRMDWSSYRFKVAGHILTNREHHCGDFKDEFDWTTLSPHYLRRIGWERKSPAGEQERREGETR